MPTFLCRARDGDGRLLIEQVEAASRLEAAGLLEKRGLLPISVEAQSGKASAEKGPARGGRKPPLKELAMSVRQLATLVRAGVVIHTALETVALQCENPSLKQSFEEVAREVTGGASLSKAMARHPRVFDDPFVNAVDAGQMSGKLDLILMRLATFMEIGLKRRASVKAALRHPVIVLCAFTAAFFFLVRFVVPQFTNIFSRLHTNGADIGE